MKLAAIDVMIIAAYMAVIVYIAWRSRRFAGRNLENYFLGGRNMPGWMTGISYAASMMSADSAVAYGGLAAPRPVRLPWTICCFCKNRFSPTARGSRRRRWSRRPRSKRAWRWDRSASRNSQTTATGCGALSRSRVVTKVPRA
ncbi:MAG TPA: hypothetical protein VEU62_02295, partial [Bryobacterales bacterium]|nr:hypothetical protein [Bryobacterales bacterium]